MSITYRAAVLGDIRLTGPEHAHLDDAELLAEGLREAKRQGDVDDEDDVVLADWTETHPAPLASLELGRAGTCSACSEAGIHVDTTAGEIVRAGRVVATVAGEIRLMANERGSLICDDCSETLEREAEQKRIERQSTIEALEAEEARQSAEWRSGSDARNEADARATEREAGR